MPELPDLTIYREFLERLLKGSTLRGIRLRSPFLLRTVDPPVSDLYGTAIQRVSRLGKYLVFHLNDELFLVFHLMIAGRFLWKKTGSPIPGKIGLAAFDFSSGTLLLTEAGSKKRASLHVIRGGSGLGIFDRGGIEILQADVQTFTYALTRENHTLKRALTDPRLFAGIGNSYSDEILHHARLSPLALSSRLSDEEIERLYRSSRATLTRWIEELRRDAGEKFPAKVTAFREGMAVHGRYGKPCPACGNTVQRIVYSENECNYCPTCQTGGRILADRSLSRILKRDWPRTVQELEELQSTMPLGKSSRSSRAKSR
jgi:formamidopyrimidine-DNA glycosylase